VSSEPRRVAQLLASARRAAGFFPEEEAAALYSVARIALATGPIVEIGTYLGRSTLFLAAAVVAEGRGTVYTVDHHRGSEEMQPGWPHHDPTLVDPGTGQMDSLARFRQSLRRAHGDDVVTAVVGDSSKIARNWSAPAGLVLIDGGHGEDVCWSDYRNWSPRVAPGGRLAFHDVFPDPKDGGRPPYDCYCDALESGRFEEDVSAGCGSLRVLVARRFTRAD
jgi:MMP 1-O-methyltransferase